MFKWLSHSSWTSHGLADVAGGFVHALKRLAAATWKLAGKPREVWDGKSRRERCLSRSRLRLSSFFTIKKPASYASWTYFNFPLFFSFLIPLPISADEQQTVAISNSSWARFVRYHFLFHLSFGVVMEALKRKQSTGCPLESPRVFARSWLNLSNLLSKALRTTGGPSSSCEMIILRNKSHGEILLELV